MKITSDDFNDGTRLSDVHAYARENESPHLAWEDIPDGTVEFAIICDDPDAPVGNWVHWVLYEIPANITSLPRGIESNSELEEIGGARHGVNSWGNNGYDGPHPPPGPEHRYIFQVFALNKKLDLPYGANSNTLRKAMTGRIIEEAEITGTYSR